MRWRWVDDVVMSLTRVRTHAGTRHATSDEVAAQIEQRYGREEVSDEVAAAIASWYQSPSPQGMPFTLLAQGSVVERSTLLDAIHRERSIADVGSYRELDMLATWVIHHDG